MRVSLSDIKMGDRHCKRYIIIGWNLNKNLYSSITLYSDFTKLYFIVLLVELSAGICSQIKISLLTCSIWLQRGMLLAPVGCSSSISQHFINYSLALSLTFKLVLHPFLLQQLPMASFPLLHQLCRAFGGTFIHE